MINFQIASAIYKDEVRTIKDVMIGSICGLGGFYDKLTNEFPGIIGINNEMAIVFVLEGA